MTDTSIHTASCVWEVQAGLIPEQPEPEFTKRWALTSDEANADNNRELWLERIEAATEYYKSLLDPRQVNWVRLDWIWF